MQKQDKSNEYSKQPLSLGSSGSVADQQYKKSKNYEPLDSSNVSGRFGGFAGVLRRFDVQIHSSEQMEARFSSRTTHKIAKKQMEDRKNTNKEETRKKQKSEDKCSLLD